MDLQFGLLSYKLAKMVALKYSNFQLRKNNNQHIRVMKLNSYYFD